MHISGLHSERSSHRSGAFLDALFASSIQDALDLIQLRIPKNDRDLYFEAVIAWGGCQANKAAARSIITGKLYFTAVIQDDSLIILISNPKGSFQINLDYFPNYPKPKTNHKTLSIVIEVLIKTAMAAHAPDAAATSSLLAV